MKNILILCGGQSPEHEISVRSARNVWKALDKSKYEVNCVGISKTGKWQLIDSLNGIEAITIQGSTVWITPGQNEPFSSVNKNLGEIDVVLPILHGPNGEDGAIQGLLKILGIPFIGPGILGSAIAMDKDIAKRLLKDAGLFVAKWELLLKGDPIPEYHEISAKLGETVFVKPANMGSSVGVSKVAQESDWKPAIQEAFRYDKKVLVEEMITGKELECAVKGNDQPLASGVGEVSGPDYYSYEEKYTDQSRTNVVIPAAVDKKQVPHLKKVAEMAYKALCCEGLARVDMFLQQDGKILVNEVNTMPGFTNISMYPKLWEEEGISYSELLDQLIELAIERAK